MLRPLLLGHRGARATRAVAENTIPSFDLALKHGCHGFEFDVRLSGKGRAIITHDDELGGIRVTDPRFDDLRPLPQLQDVLSHFAKRAFLDIELKVPGLETELAIALAGNPPQRGFVVSSFLPEVLTSLQIRSTHTPLGFICDRRDLLPYWRTLPVQYVIPHWTLVNAALVSEVHNAKKLLLTWTVNDAPSMLRLADWGVDGIISDQTELLVRTLAMT